MSSPRLAQPTFKQQTIKYKNRTLVLNQDKDLGTAKDFATSIALSSLQHVKTLRPNYISVVILSICSSSFLSTGACNRCIADICFIYKFLKNLHLKLIA